MFAHNEGAYENALIELFQNMGWRLGYTQFCHLLGSIPQLVGKAFVYRPAFVSYFYYL